MFPIKLLIFDPANGICFMHDPITKPSEIGITWVTPSPESRTVPVKLIWLPKPEDEIKARTACTAICKPFALKV